MHEAVVGKAPVVRDWKVAALVGVVEDRIPGLASGEPALWSASLALFSKAEKNALDIGHLVMVWGGMGLILVWNHNK